MQSNIINGNNIEVLKTYPDNHFDSVVVDPPYGLNFLGKDWDSNTGHLESWEETFRVLKPGGHIVAFSAARTYHHLAMALETVGFEIRDQLMWVYSSGFPKAQDMGKNILKRKMKNKNLSLPQDEVPLLTETDRKGYFTHTNGKTYRRLPNTKGQGAADQYGGGDWKYTYEEQIEVTNKWAGWKPSLKPAHEPLVLARKPFKGSCVDNVLKHGTGAMNIDACRIDLPHNDKLNDGIIKKDNHKLDTQNMGWGFKSVDREAGVGRYPSNVIGEIPEKQECFFNPEYDKNYIYCPKVSRKERHVGHEIPEAMFGQNEGMYDDKGQRYAVELDKRETQSNNHPTVKPQALMEWLVKLITTPGGKVLDPFNGSGSTGMACKKLGFNYTGIELNEEYCEISRKRINAWDNPTSTFNELFNEK